LDETVFLVLDAFLEFGARMGLCLQIFLHSANTRRRIIRVAPQIQMAQITKNNMGGVGVLLHGDLFANDCLAKKLSLYG